MEFYQGGGPREVGEVGDEAVARVEMGQAEGAGESEMGEWVVVDIEPFEAPEAFEIAISGSDVVLGNVELFKTVEATKRFEIGDTVVE